jgi:hypothetical protein
MDYTEVERKGFFTEAVQLIGLSKILKKILPLSKLHLIKKKNMAKIIMA